eukprot:1772484-Amphidinium_carterae.1
MTGAIHSVSTATEEHEEDRRRVQETLRGLEADVHTRWQRYVAEFASQFEDPDPEHFSNGDDCGAIIAL